MQIGRQTLYLVIGRKANRTIWLAGSCQCFPRDSWRFMRLFPVKRMTRPCGRNDLNLFSNLNWVRSPARSIGAEQRMQVPSWPLSVSRNGAVG
jgi:hypothetical protein